MEAIYDISKRIKASGIRCCIECRSLDINYFDRVFIKGELYSFPYCNNCGLVQWHVIPRFHLSLEKLYDLYLQMADEFNFPKKKILQDLEHIKKRKGDEGYSDDVVIFKEIFERKI